MRITDKVLEELVALEAAARDIDIRVTEIRNAIKEQGSVSTKNYVAIVQDQERTCLAGLDSVAKVFGRETLENQGLIKTVHYKVVRVGKKEVFPKMDI